MTAPLRISRQSFGVLSLRTLLPVVLAAACGGESGPGDVLLISIDTLRPDHLGIYGYERATSPNLDRWFADAARYERAYTTDANTSPAVVSMLTGLRPQEHRVRLLYQHVDSDLTLLPEMLPDAYQTAAVVSNMVLTDEAMAIASRFDHFDDYVDQVEPRREIYERRATATTDAALRWLRGARDPERPAFLWVHYVDPHGPYQPPEPWEASFDHDAPVTIDESRISAYQREPGVDDGLVYVDRYDAEIAYLDAELGRLLEGYAALRPIDAALVLFTADHGESMMEHERWFSHGYHVYEEIARIPLLLRGPGIEAGAHSKLASIRDVAPTVLRFAGAAVPDPMPGVDLRDASGLSDDRTVFIEGRHQDLQRRAAIRGRTKWTLAMRPNDPIPVDQWRYDLAEDPKERRPVRWRDDAEAQAFLELVRRDPDPSGMPRRYMRGRNLMAPKVAPDAPPEALERLRALGYVE